MSEPISDTATRERAQRGAQAVPSGVPTGRVVGVLLLCAGTLALAGNLLHPRYSGADVAIYRQIAGSSMFVVADLLLLPALVLGTIGLAGLARRGSGSFGDVARVTAIVGGALAIAQTGVELQALRQQARTFAAAASLDRVGAFWSTNSLDRLNGALTASWIVLLLGVTPLLLALIQLTARTAPGGVALVGGAGGVICAGVGVINLLSQDQGHADVTFLVGSLLTTTWILTTGYLLASKPELSRG